jgi:hypothetical protein
MNRQKVHMLSLSLITICPPPTTPRKETTINRYFIIQIMKLFIYLFIYPLLAVIIHESHLFFRFLKIFYRVIKQIK